MSVQHSQTLTTEDTRQIKTNTHVKTVLVTVETVKGELDGIATLGLSRKLLWMGLKVFWEAHSCTIAANETHGPGTILISKLHPADLMQTDVPRQVTYCCLLMLKAKVNILLDKVETGCCY